MRTIIFGTGRAGPIYPYVDTCLSAFGVGRCMFESNFPVDKGSFSYAVCWNAFKRLASGASADEKTKLFSGHGGQLLQTSRPRSVLNECPVWSSSRVMVR